MSRRFSEKGRIDVIVRKRPLSELEISRGDEDIVICNNDCGIIREFKCKIDGTSFIEEHEFKVDRFYDENSDNELIYNDYVKPLVECAFREKKTCSCFTYGQTGSGKTFTMIGSRISKNSRSDSGIGIYEYAANDIYRILKEPEFEGKIDVVLSFYEIYCGKLYDLLQNRKLVESLDNGKNEVIIKDLSVRTVSSKEELVDLMLNALNLRRIGQNSQNDKSSRSHALLRIDLREKESFKLHGSMVFIDLAGSERAADSVTMSKQTQIDGAGINKSLLALKECIRAMDLEKIHIPFRNSELTKVLKDVFLGDGRSVMIANICPSFNSCEQTLNTLRYASKVKSFKSNSTIFSSTSIKSFDTNYNISSCRGYNRFLTVPGNKFNKNNPYYKASSTCKISKDLKRTTPRSSLSPVQTSLDKSKDKMDVDTTSPNTDNTMSNTTNTTPTTHTSDNDSFKTLDGIEKFLKSQFNMSMERLNVFLDSIQLNETNKEIYDYVTHHSTQSSINGIENGETYRFDEVLRDYEIYKKIATLIHLSNPPKSTDDLRNLLKFQFKILLKLKQDIDQLENK